MISERVTRALEKFGPAAASSAGRGTHSTSPGAGRSGEPIQHPDVLVSRRGGPPVQPPSRRGFGLVLIEKVLAAELRGEVRLEFSPEGVRCMMDMALDRVSAH